MSARWRWIARVTLVGLLVVAIVVGIWTLRVESLKRAAYQRLTYIDDESAKLARAKATMEEVWNSLGEPTHTSERQGRISWYYDLGFYRGHHQGTRVISFDPVTRRISDFGQILRN